MIDDKALFYTVCGLAGLPVAPVHAFLYRDHPGWTRTGAAPSTREEWSRLLDSVLPDAFVAKPATGDMGIGVRAFRRRGAGFLEGPREVGGAGELYDSLLAGADAGFVLQQRVRNHELLAELCGVETLQSVRLVTLVDDAREVTVLAAALKVAVVDAVVDHYNHGATGNGAASIDVQTGRLGRLRLPRADRLRLVEVDRHPRTGRPCTGVRLPDWEEALELVRRASIAFGMLRTIGWDVALTPDGPLLMEANTGWGPFNHVWACEPIRRRLEEAVAREAAPPAVSGRGSGSRPGRSSPSGATRPGRGPYRRGSTRGTRESR